MYGRSVPPEPLGAVPQLDAGTRLTGLEPWSEGVSLPLADHCRPLADQRRHLPQLIVLLQAFPELLLIRRALLVGL